MMDVGALMFRAAICGEAQYAPFTFVGDWSEKDQAIISAELKKHVPEVVDSMFNNWLFAQYIPGHIVGYRATWDRGHLTAKTASEMAEKIATYYAPLYAEPAKEA